MEKPGRLLMFIFIWTTNDVHKIAPPAPQAGALSAVRWTAGFPAALGTEPPRRWRARRGWRWARGWATACRCRAGVFHGANSSCVALAHRGGVGGRQPHNIQQNAKWKKMKFVKNAQKNKSAKNVWFWWVVVTVSRPNLSWVTEFILDREVHIRDTRACPTAVGEAFGVPHVAAHLR